MDRRAVHDGILRAWRTIVFLELAETISSPAPLEVNDEFRDLIINENSDYVTIYTAGLRLSHYNFLLNDYSFVQFGWFSENHVRYAYFPNPFTMSPDATQYLDWAQWRDEVTAELLTHEEYLDLLRDLKPEIRAPIIRYENAPDQYRAFNHPCSHFHFGHHADNRWPSNRLLTPLAFTLLILKHYYGAKWRLIGNDSADVLGNSLESKLVAEKMNCRIIGDDLFSAEEGKSFYLS
jgi:hypothetical protein